MVILALESSTSAAKGLVFDTEKGVLAQASEPYGPDVCDAKTQEPEGVYGLLTQSGRRAVEKAGVPCDAAVLVSTWHSLLLCSGDGLRPVGRIHLWSDLCAAPTAEKYAVRPGFRRDFYRRTGCFPHATYPFFKFAYLKDTLDVSGVLRLCSQGEYLYERMTGRRAESRSIASGSGFLNLRALEWDEDLLKEAGLRSWQLGELVPDGFSAPLAIDAARALGLPAGTPVYIGGSDGGMTQIGCSAEEPGVFTMSVGTSGALRVACRGPLLPEEGTTWCYYLTGGRYIAGAATNGACNCVNDFMNESGKSLKQLDHLLAGRDFSDAPVYLPFVYGERCPGWHSAPYGGFTSEKGSLAARYYAVLEGVLFCLYQCWLPLTGVSGAPREIRVSGGIVNSAPWLSMAADIFGCPLRTSSVQHASLLGGALLAAKAAGANTRGRAWKTERVVEPNPANAAFIRERFAKYLREYGAANRKKPVPAEEGSRNA